VASVSEEIIESYSIDDLIRKQERLETLLTVATCSEKAKRQLQMELHAVRMEHAHRERRRNSCDKDDGRTIKEMARTPLPPGVLLGDEVDLGENR